MGTFRDLMIGLGFQANAKSIAQVQSDANALKSSLSKILGVVGITLTLSGIKNFIQETSSAAADFKATATQFQNTFGDVANEAQASLDKVSAATGISANRIKATYSAMGSFAKTSGMDAAQANEYVAKAMQEIADNAAYMDVSVEEAASTFQRLLKGNFQVDDKMNFNFTESARNALANEMYGANFADLEDVQKFEVVYEKLRRANIDMGAVKVDENGNVTYRQAASEADEYTNQVGELSDALQQLKVAIGNIFLEPFLKVQTKLASVTHEIAEALGDESDNTSLVYRAKEKLNRAVENAIGLFDKLVNGVKWTIQLMGGLENTLETLKGIFIVLAGFMIAGKITSISKALSAVNWKLIGILAILMAIVYAVQDFMTFMNGGDSLIGRWLDDVGIGQENARDTILSLQEEFGDLATNIKETFSEIGHDISEFMDEHGADINEIADGVKKFMDQIAKINFDGFVTQIESLIDALSSLLDMINKIRNGDLSGAIESGKSFVINSLKSDSAMKMATNPIGTLVNKVGIGAINDTMGWNLPKTNLELVERIGSALGGNAANIGKSTEEIKDLTQALTDAGDGMEDTASVTESSAGKMTSAISGTATDSGNILRDFASSTYKYGADSMDLLASGINDNAFKVKEAYFALAQYGRDNLGFSKPKKGPMSNADTWMPDMMQLFVKGINSQKENLKEAVVGIGETIKGNQDGLMALGQSATASMAAGNTGRNINVTQNISYANTFNGDTRANQVNAAGAMRNNAKDTTSYLANAIAFGR